MPATSEDFRSVLTGRLRAAEREGQTFVDVSAGELHWEVACAP